jgi:hypothetical protein
MNPDFEVHAGPSAIDDLASVVRGLNEGRAFVIVDRTVSAEGLRYLRTSFQTGQMQARIHTTSNTIAAVPQQIELAREFADYVGGALVSVGHSGLIAAAKAVATLAANGPDFPTSHRLGLRVAPRTHIAIPDRLGPAEECTDSVNFADTRLGTVVDGRLAGATLIDHRLFEDVNSRNDEYLCLVENLAACTVINPSGTLRDRTLALTAANFIARPDPRPVDTRTALAYATAAHPDYRRCHRCEAGTVTPSARGGAAHRSAAEVCLQQALTRAGRNNRGGCEAGVWRRPGSYH